MLFGNWLSEIKEVKLDSLFVNMYNNWQLDGSLANKVMDGNSGTIKISYFEYMEYAVEKGYQIHF